MKEEIFLKFKDYNRELEKILEKKDFSKDTKNLLLSMFYKIDISYNDYYTVKRKSKSKQEYLENILANIKNSNKINLINPSDIEFEEYANGKMNEIDFKAKKITVIANEVALLSSILELNDFQIHFNEEYNLIRNSMPYLFNMAYDMENIEVLRDFNAWSWNILVNQIKDININLIYQNLKIAINKNIFDVMQKEERYVDIVEYIHQELLKFYPEKTVNDFVQLIFKISILIYINISENEKKRLEEEKEIIENDLKEIKDKKLYIEKITQEKKNLTKEVKEIDLIINNRELLLEEYEKRNKKLSIYNKIFSISHLVEKMQKEKKKILEKIDLCNKNIEPKTYLENKNKLQKDYNLLKDIKFEGNNNLVKEINKLQKIFLQDILLNKIEKIIDRNEMLDCMYEIRYYNFLPYNKEKSINDVEEFSEDLNIVKEKMIKKLYDNKMINTISTNEKNDIEIVKNIFDLKIINLENIYLEVRKKDNQYIICFYDEKDTLEKEVGLNLEFNKKDKIKLKKKIKLFI